MGDDVLRIILYPLGVAALWGGAWVVSLVLKRVIPDGKLKRLLYKRR
jgi:hypothetical protein